MTLDGKQLARALAGPKPLRASTGFDPRAVEPGGRYRVTVSSFLAEAATGSPCSARAPSARPAWPTWRRSSPTSVR